MNRPILVEEIAAAQDRLDGLRLDVIALENFIAMKLAQLAYAEPTPGVEAVLMMRGESTRPSPLVYGDLKRRTAPPPVDEVCTL